MIALSVGLSALAASGFHAGATPRCVASSAAPAISMSASLTAFRNYQFRLEYTVNALSDKLGMPAPTRLASDTDESWVSVLEESLPYLERQWSTAAKNKLLMWEATPQDALDSMQRGSLRDRYVQRLEQQVASLSEQQDV